MRRHFWRGVGLFWGGGETAYHSFLSMVLGQFIEQFAYSRGAAYIRGFLELYNAEKLSKRQGGLI